MNAFERLPGVYLCEGCGIKDAVSVDDLETLVTGDLNISHCRRSDAFCTGEGYEQLSKDVSDGSVNQPIVVGCSPRVMCEEFGALPVEVTRANIREQVIWCHPAGTEDTQMIAADYVRMAVAKTANAAPPEPHGEGVTSVTLLVVGGGVTGLTAALEASKTGVEVVLVEKTGALGGWAGKWSKHIPYRPPYRGLQDNPVPALIKQVEDDPAITVMTDTIVAETDGMPGKFTVMLKDGERETWQVFGAIVVATGWRPYDPENLAHLGFGATPDVITDIDYEAILASGEITRKSNGAPARNIAFVISDDADRMAYSSGVSDRVAIKQALQTTELADDAMVFVIYQDLRAHGTAEEFYREAQEAGVIFQKGAVKSVDANLTMIVADDLLGEEIPMAGLDLVVLSTGMVPNSTNIDLKPAPEGAELLSDDINPRVPITVAGKLVNGDTPPAEPSGATSAEGEEDGEIEPALPGGPILNLQYRQGPHLPVLADGFADSHYICFPYETRRTGIYTCGPVRRAMTVGEARQDAQGAVLKAIQAMRSAHESVAVHPRVGDLSFPEFGLDICTKCRRCTVECPFGAIDEEENGYPVLNAARCRRCGTCMGACPVRTISFKNYNVAMVSDMIKAVDMPDEFAEKPRIIVFACENDAYPALDMAGINRHQLTPYVRIIPVRCLGSVTMLWISTALESGYDGVMMMGCKSGDDYQCHFVKGSGIAEERMAKVGETLKSMMLEEERVQLHEISIADSGHVTEVLNGFAEKIDEIGPNPFKGF